MTLIKLRMLYRDLWAGGEEEIGEDGRTGGCCEFPLSTPAAYIPRVASPQRRTDRVSGHHPTSLPDTPVVAHAGEAVAEWNTKRVADVEIVPRNVNERSYGGSNETYLCIWGWFRIHGSLRPFPQAFTCSSRPPEVNGVSAMNFYNTVLWPPL